MHKISAGIIGTGYYLPEKVLTNFDLEKMVQTNDAWIVERTGIHERRIAADDEPVSALAQRAAEMALAATSKIFLSSSKRICDLAASTDTSPKAVALDVSSKSRLTMLPSA